MEVEKRWIEAAFASLEVLARAPGVTIRRAVEGAVERIYLERAMDDGGVRYVRVNWAGDADHGGVPECYSLRGGIFGTQDAGRDFDGGTYGALPAIVEFVRKWIVVAVDESQWAALAVDVPSSIGIKRA